MRALTPDPSLWSHWSAQINSPRRDRLRCPSDLRLGKRRRWRRNSARVGKPVNCRRKPRFHKTSRARPVGIHPGAARARAPGSADDPAPVSAAPRGWRPCARAHARGGCTRARGHAGGGQRGPRAHGGHGAFHSMPTRRTVLGSRAAGLPPAGVSGPRRPAPGPDPYPSDRAPPQPGAARRPLPKRQRQSGEAAPREPHTLSRHDCRQGWHTARTGHARRPLARLLMGQATRADSVPASPPNCLLVANPRPLLF